MTGVEDTEDLHSIQISDARDDIERSLGIVYMFEDHLHDLKVSLEESDDRLEQLEKVRHENQMPIVAALSATLKEEDRELVRLKTMLAEKQAMLVKAETALADSQAQIAKIREAARPL